MQRFCRLILGLIIISLIGSGVILADGVSDSIMQPISSVPPLIANLPGTELQLLPKNFDVWSCDWSPDSKALVFSGKMQGEDSAKMRIWYWSLEPVSDPTPFTNTDQMIDFSPRWSPNGAKILMSRRSFPVKTNNPNISAAIWLKEILNGAGKQLTSGPEDRDPFWSPDGTQMVFSRGKGPYSGQLYIYNFSEGVTKLLTGQEGELLMTPWWGKDGNIYYTKLTPSPKTVIVSSQSYQVMEFGRGGIWAVNPVTNTCHPVICDEYDNRLPALSPDGQRIAFVSNRIPTKEGNGKFDRGSLFIKKINTNEIFYITNKVGLNGGSLSWSPDGKKLAFFTFRNIRPAIWVINLP
jgi:Tol biopolymer transport system component